MSKYGDVARLAVKRARTGVDPVEAWRTASAQIFPNQEPSRDKGCPRCAFLGLAQEDMIAGVPPGNYTKSRDNRRYAVMGVNLLMSDPILCEDPNEMWQRIMSGVEKQHNEQMSVVAALWKSGDIKGSPRQ